MFAWLWLAACGSPDQDEDGISVEAGDCDDLDGAVAPGVDETCDGVDQDCDGVVDDDPVDGETYVADDDGDGFGDDDRAIVACARPDGYAVDGGDCDDDDDRVNPDAEDSPTRDRNCDGRVDEPPTDEFYDGPVTVELATVDCDGTDVRYYVETVGWTTDGLVFAQETANVEPQWSDEHDLRSFEYAENGSWDHLEQVLGDGTTTDVGDWQRNVNTLFRCEWHYAFDDIMSYAFAVYDSDGVFADCLALGEDPGGMVNGNHERTNEPSFSLSACQIGVSGF